MLNEIKEFDQYTRSFDSNFLNAYRDFLKRINNKEEIKNIIITFLEEKRMYFRLNYRHLYKQLSGIDRVMTVIARGCLFDDNAYFISEANQISNLKLILNAWCGFSVEMPEDLTEKGKNTFQSITNWFPTYCLHLLVRKCLEDYIKGSQDESFIANTLNIIIKAINAADNSKTSLVQAIECCQYLIYSENIINEIKEKCHSVHESKNSSELVDFLNQKKLIKKEKESKVVVICNRISKAKSIESLAILQTDLIDNLIPMNQCNRYEKIYKDVLLGMYSRNRSYNKPMYSESIADKSEGKKNSYKYITFEGIIANAIDLGSLREDCINSKLATMSGHDIDQINSTFEYIKKEFNGINIKTDARVFDFKFCKNIPTITQASIRKEIIDKEQFNELLKADRDTVEKTIKTLSDVWGKQCEIIKASAKKAGYEIDDSFIADHKVKDLNEFFVLQSKILKFIINELQNHKAFNKYNEINAFIMGMIVIHNKIKKISEKKNLEEKTKNCLISLSNTVLQYITELVSWNNYSMSFTNKIYKYKNKSLSLIEGADVDSVVRVIFAYIKANSSYSDKYNHSYEVIIKPDVSNWCIGEPKLEHSDLAKFRFLNSDNNIEYLFHMELIGGNVFKLKVNDRFIKEWNLDVVNEKAMISQDTLRFFDQGSGAEFITKTGN